MAQDQGQDPGRTIDFGDPGVRREFKTLYDAAVDAEQEQFLYQGAPVLTGYAYYLLEFAAERLKLQSLRPRRPKTLRGNQSS